MSSETAKNCGSVDNVGRFEISFLSEMRDVLDITSWYGMLKPEGSGWD